MIKNMKFVEIRDAATFIPALTYIIGGEDNYLARRAGFGNPVIVLVKLSTLETEIDWAFWESRTMQLAHKWLADNWDKHTDGGVLDVEFITGVTKKEKISEKYSSESEVSE